MQCLKSRSHPSTRTLDHQAGDAGLVPFAVAHASTTPAEEPLCFPELFRSDQLADVLPNQWMAFTRPELVEAHPISMTKRCACSRRKSRSSSSGYDPG